MHIWCICMCVYIDVFILNVLDFITSSSLMCCMQAWFLDQFGVLHDGKKPYPGAISTCMFSSVSLGSWETIFRWYHIVILGDSNVVVVFTF